MEPKKKRKKWMIVLIVLAVIATLIGIFIYRVQKQAREILASMNTSETAQVERRDLVSTISASGKIVGIENRTVRSSLSGVLINTVAVEVGDEIKEGDLILEFDADDLNDQLKSAKNTNAEASLTNAHNVSAAAEALRDAQNNYYREIPNLQSTVDRTLREFQLAAKAVEKAKSEYDADPTEAKENAYEQAQTTANNAYATYDQAVDNLDAQQMTLLEAIETAQYNYDLAMMRYGDDTTGDSVENAKEKIEKTEVFAPISGTVTAVNVEAGETYTGGSIIEIEDCSGYEVSAEIDEYDIGKIKVGQKVVIRTNGTGDEEFSGRVEKIAPRATSTNASSSLTGTAAVTSSASNDVKYEVRISLDDAVNGLKLDMTAKLSIIIEEKDNVLTVPYDAVQTDDEGNSFIEVVEENAVPATEEDLPEMSGIPTRKIIVETGIESAYYIEVVSDELSEGMEVLVPQTDNSLDDLMQMMQSRGAMGGF